MVVKLILQSIKLAPMPQSTLQNADALAGPPSARRRRSAAGSLERTIAAAEAPCGRSTNSLTTVPEGAA